MNDVVGQKFVFVVGQQLAEIPSQTGIYNQFCSLIPLVDMEGRMARSVDFPDTGDVWWMIRPVTRGLAEPGRLVTGVVEESLKKGQIGLAHYQAMGDSVEALNSRDYIEIIDVGNTMIAEPRDLIRRTFTMDHPPLSVVYVKWRDFIIGGLRAVSKSVGKDGIWSVQFSPESSDDSCIQFPRKAIDEISNENCIYKKVKVSLIDRPVSKSDETIDCNYFLIEREALNEVIPADAEKLILRTDEQVVQQVAKRLLSRSKRQKLVAMLDELAASANESPDSIDGKEKAILDSLHKTIHQDVMAVDELARSIVDSGIVASQIDTAIESGVEKHIADNATKLANESKKRVAETQTEVEFLLQQKRQLQSELTNLRTKKEKELDSELEKRRKAFDANLQKEDETSKKKLAELKRQENVLSENLQKVATTLAEKRDEVVNQFLTIAPLLGELGLLQGTSTRSAILESGQTSKREQEESLAATATKINFSIPSFSRGATRELLSEEKFFERFCSHVEARGFRYREIDLIAFHISVKCGDLTILGGSPGTGKSSLARLYAEAIRGEGCGVEPKHFLHVSVSPSWLDMRDLIGHVNALNGTFQPADTSLFQHLVFAQEEHRELNDDTELYFVCLDEMNLSHVEHYFHGFLQVLEHSEGVRDLRCFADQVVDPSSAFAKWSSIEVPQSIRFIGTVNFDETTKQLSQRLLDRVNLLRLPPNQLPLDLEQGLLAAPVGSPVRLSDYQSWIKSTATFGDDLAAIVDSLRDDLQVLNCPMNPRRFSAMRRFIASWPASLPHSQQALDLQIAQRVLPQIRGLFQPGSRRAVERIRMNLEKKALEFSESLRVIEEILGAEPMNPLFEMETLS